MVCPVQFVLVCPGKCHGAAPSQCSSLRSQSTFSLHLDVSASSLELRQSRTDGSSYFVIGTEAVNVAVRSLSRLRSLTAIEQCRRRSAFYLHANSRIYIGVVSTAFENCDYDW
ncbi:hypothetical protein K466DRAFT_365943 [Polyporus arcularius HHB13444]|uniref:Uncharacterized protein n=1 Tax=Polyporus arcularius HHB13444 TaxID=1314778 RepID=A0A5C3PND4_9APHY|nr:hypothetical protein K466DRAFT_365943 [Polyporus arcularius HHB13444]